MSYPTVRLDDLVKDGCNFTDQSFAVFVDTFMQRFMPGFPMGLLDTSSYERWEIEPSPVHCAERVSWVRWECEECGEEYTEKPDNCCYVTDEDGDETTVPHAFEKTEHTAYVVSNENTNEYLSRQDYIRHETLNEDYSDVPLDGGDEVLGWTDKAEAMEAAEHADRTYDSEHGHESRYGFPWAQNWCFRPDDVLSEEDLEAAGFVLATYLGGVGDYREDERFRLCGIDGGGYSLKGQHFAKLCALAHERRSWPVDTDKGKALITTDYRSGLEKLGQDVETSNV